MQVLLANDKARTQRTPDTNPPHTLKRNEVFPICFALPPSHLCDVFGALLTWNTTALGEKYYFPSGKETSLEKKKNWPHA